MRLKTTTLPFLAIGLLAGSAVGVAAQDDEAASAATSFTGTVLDADSLSFGIQTEVEGFVESTGIVGTSRWQASDERLTGDVTYTGNWLNDESEDISIQSATFELTNDGGSWLGEATALSAPGIDTDTVIFTGRDGYEGLTAYVLIDWGVEPTEFLGVVFSAAMPEIPEPYAAE